jgi:predicted permease
LCSDGETLALLARIPCIVSALFQGLLEELRVALRGFLRTPLFTFIAVSSLALGIGANSAIFSLIDQVMLQSLPVPRPGELIQIYQSGSHYGSNMGPRMNSHPIYLDFRDQSPVLNGVFCRREAPISLFYEGSTERTQVEMVSGNYFEVLGVKAALGRVFTTEDDKNYGGHPVAVLSHEFWQTRFGGNPSIVGKTVKINNFPMTIIGVSAKEFYGLDPTRSSQIRVPTAMVEQMMPFGWEGKLGKDRRTRWVNIFARLKPGVSVQQAQAALQTQFTAIRQNEVKAEAFAKASTYDKEQFLRGRIVVVPANNGYSGMRQQVAEPLWILLGIVCLVLLIACTNVANLLIARTSARRKELAVRAALGASRWRLMRPLLGESLMLSLAGGGCGLLLAFGLNQLLLSFIPAGSSSLRLSATPDWRVMGFTFCVAVVTGLIFGLLPAYGAGKADAAPALKEEGRGMSSGSGNLLRKALVGVQVALSIILLIGAGLFVRTLQNLKQSETGLEISRLITFQMEPKLIGYSSDRTKQFMRDLVQRLEAAPGVKSAAIGMVAKMADNEWDSSITVEGYARGEKENLNPHMDFVSPGYIETMGMKILEGRDFRDSDSGAKTTVCLINKKLADRCFKGRSPIGYHIGFGSDPGTKTDIEIVGVFSDAKYENLRDEVPIQMMTPYMQRETAVGGVAYVRTSADERGAFQQIQTIVKQMEPSLPIFAMRSFEEQINQVISNERMMSFLAAAFGIVATILAAIGLYGVLALAVARRTKEIGIRLALGAKASSVIGLVLGEIMLMIAGGIVVGVPCALLLARYVESQLFGLKAADPITIGGAVGLLVSVALLAAWLPARRATRINPIEVLHYE